MACTKTLDVQRILAQEPTGAARWQTLVKTDPKRTVRALTIVGFDNETVDGDTMWDMPHVLVHLKNEAQNPKSEVWKRLVDAGVYNALCFCVLNAQGTALVKDENAATQAKAEQQAKQQMYSPWFIPFQVICAAVLFCGNVVTPAEHRMIEDIRKHWSTMMQRIWTQPMYCLEPDQRGVVERAMLAQVPIRLAVLDPSFLGVFLKPSDLTFAVCFRNWIYASSRQDIQLNSGFLVALLSQPHTPPHWTRYLESHPLPPMRALLPRIILGASKAAGQTPKKRTPQQAADTIVSSCVRHLRVPEMTLNEQSLELHFLRALTIPSKTEFLALPRAMFKSADIWAAAVEVLRRAAKEGTDEAQEAYLDALEAFSALMGPISKEGPEFANALAVGWASCGLFEALDESVDYLVKIIGGPMTLTFILKILVDDVVPRVNAETRNLLRALFPRPRLASGLTVSLPGKPQEHMDQQAEFMSRIKDTGDLDPSNPIWRQAAWEMLANLMAAIGVENALSVPCSRSSCNEPVSAARKVSCKKCEAQFCSQGCLKSDKEHGRACPGIDSAQRIYDGVAATNRDIRNRQLVAYSILTVVTALALWILYVLLRGMWRLVAGLVWRLVGLIPTSE
ncbi:hypothetical protein L226DRAFT_553092 [Lentinus tigrinus ALCF2SS1-7]|uniref:MYND-type domain-containing protein n=1 Tax=Lentinus tigrinus ALCF2SS1-6 TaxID=1328759 RepID=A0A5C2SDN8_9APHY|nr:hypothetical protein L227DRAFT_592545 [Lentinus tigrinus ALCF2SS1-6]RPD74344.1 hypothetical protein L226DRAFT_553092 [Lentinus tigrinus ALCF2SS1-7]